MRFLKIRCQAWAVVLLPFTVSVIGCGEPSERPPDFASGEGRPSPVPAQEQVIEVGDQTLEQFTRVYVDVQEINRDLQDALARVDDDVEQARRIRQEHISKMEEVVREHDFEVDRYQQIVNAVNADEQLRERFMEMLEEVHDEREP